MPQSLLLSCVFCCQEARWSFVACHLFLTLDFPQWLFQTATPAAIDWLPLPLSFHCIYICHNGVICLVFSTISMHNCVLINYPYLSVFQASGIAMGALRCLISWRVLHLIWSRFSYVYEIKLNITFWSSLTFPCGYQWLLETFLFPLFCVGYSLSEVPWVLSLDQFLSQYRGPYYVLSFCFLTYGTLYSVYIYICIYFSTESLKLVIVFWGKAEVGLLQHTIEINDF